MNTKMTDQLNVVERKRWREVQQAIADKRQALWELVDLLIEVRDSRLYREDHASFEKFVESSLGWKRQRAYQLIEACEVRQDLSKICDIVPDKESHLAELARVPQEQVGDVWQKAVEIAEEKGVDTTAKIVAAARAEVLGEVEPKAKVAPASAREPGEDDTLADQIAAAAREIKEGLLLRVTQAITHVNQVDDRAGFELLRAEQKRLRHELDSVKGSVLRATPATICPACKGRCDGCTKCGNHGWVAKD